MAIIAIPSKIGSVTKAQLVEIATDPKVKKFIIVTIEEDDNLEASWSDMAPMEACACMRYLQYKIDNWLFEDAI